MGISIENPENNQDTLPLAAAYNNSRIGTAMIALVSHSDLASLLIFPEQWGQERSI